MIMIANLRSIVKNGVVVLGGSEEYVGRTNHRYGLKGSPLGNPFELTKERYRDKVIDSYKAWINQFKNDGIMRVELERLKKKYRDTGELTLVCWCAPKRCHAEIIKEIILGELNVEENKTDCSFDR